ncbi:hypothetical protein TIFTF001_014117 [Ficus carica]|uniref:Uncharacterized protein n=1 Tax=Ficus carica TaxID=3494 RepID=A0AA88D3Q5_FICCA|nr:hypothetical protein TIFTF001_014117 [Ficus carica]
MVGEVFPKPVPWVPMVVCLRSPEESYFVDQQPYRDGGNQPDDPGRIYN